MMNRETLLKFKVRFEQEKSRIVYKNAIQNRDFEIPSEETADESDLTAVELEQSMKMRLQNREALFLRKLDEAMERIAAGTFGECEGCGDEIGEKRLEVRPTATHCVLCKEEEERKELLYIDGRQHKSLGKVLRLA